MGLRRIIKIVISKYKNCGKKVRISWSSEVSPSSQFEGMCQIHKKAKFKGEMGLGSYLGPNSRLVGKIGRFTSIARDVSSNSGTHPFRAPYATTSPCFFSLNQKHTQCGETFASKQKFSEWRTVDGKFQVVIGNDCWIGEGAFLVGGITIYDGAIVLAHATVTKDVPPYAIVAGVPAHVIGYRYDNDTIQWLLHIRWWSFSKEWFEENWEVLCDLDALRKKVEGNK